MYMVNGNMPCPKRGEYLLLFNGELGIKKGKTRSCHQHMMGLMWCWEYAGHTLPQFQTKVLN